MSQKNPDVPKISVVIPAYNEENYIARCLRSLLEQSFPSGQVEIILVDNNSTDNTVKIAQTFPRVRIIHETTPGAGIARARGWREARGEIIASTDADSQVPRHWLKKIVHTFDTQPQLVAVSGGYLFYDRDFIVNFIVKIFERSLVALSWFLAGGVMALTAANMAVRREAYLKTPGFDPNLHFGEDLNLAKKLHQYGKLKWTFNNRVKTSARRYQSLDASVVPYVLNFLSMSARDKAWRNRLDNVRD